MSKFIRLTQEDNEEIYININQISVIYIDWYTVLMAGIHGKQTGLIRLKIKSMEKLLRAINEGAIL